ncbi:hypothetical protein [Streptomyces sp. NPDC055134]
MLLRLTYLAASNPLALLRLLPMSDREKDVEILALRLSRVKIPVRSAGLGRFPAGVEPTRG